MEIVQPAWALVDLGTARKYLNLADEGQDAEVLARLVRNVTPRIETYCNRKLKSRDYHGADAFALDGNDTTRIMLPEWPITAVLSASFLDNDGVDWAINIDGARIRMGGSIELRNDIFPCGGGNILIEATCGLLPGKHDSELWTLEHACLRTLQVWWTDFVNQTGRATDVNDKGANIALEAGDLPADVRNMLDPLKRP